MHNFDRFTVKLWDELQPDNYTYLTIHTAEDLASFIKFWCGKPGMVIQLGHHVDTKRPE